MELYNAHLGALEACEGCFIVEQHQAYGGVPCSCSPRTCNLCMKTPVSLSG